MLWSCRLVNVSSDKLAVAPAMLLVNMDSNRLLHPDMDKLINSRLINRAVNVIPLVNVQLDRLDHQANQGNQDKTVFLAKMVIQALMPRTAKLSNRKICVQNAHRVHQVHLDPTAHLVPKV
jgi:hypothetical protein